MQQLQQAINSVFVQLSATLENLSTEQYAQPCTRLFGNTIGQHVRHIIELFQCLENGYSVGIVNYEKRKRDTAIESDPNLACGLLKSIYAGLNRPNKALSLEAGYDEHLTDCVLIQTNYEREIAYNLEHTIHHMALIRIGVTEVSSLVVPEEFGMAPSTVKYRKSCAQ